MSNADINRRDQYNQILKNLTNFYSVENKKLLQLLLDKGVTIAEISHHLGVRQQAVRNRIGRLS